MPELYMLPLNRVKMTRLITFFIELTDRESFSLCVLVLVKDALFRTIVRLLLYLALKEKSIWIRRRKFKV